MVYEPYPPEDFDAFWVEVVAEARAEPLDFRRALHVEEDRSTSSHFVERISFRGIYGAELEGWIAYPPAARRLPGFLWIPPYGRESALPDRYGTREGFVSMSFNFFGHDAFYREAYRPERGYFAQGAAEPNTWVFRSMFQNAYIAMRVLQAQLEVDEERCAAMGMSQGGGMAIWLGARCPIVKAVCADMPFLCAINQTLTRPVHRYPLLELVQYANSLPLGMERVMHTLSYYDTMNQATRCWAPTQVSLGERDPSVRSKNVQSAYEALPGKKALRKYDVGHDWVPDMVQNNKQWLAANM